MKLKENMSNKSSFYYNQISKKGLLENDKKLLLKKFGFINFHLSQGNLNFDNINTHNYSLIENSLLSIKNESRKPIKTTININNIKNNDKVNNFQKNNQIKTKNIIQNIQKNYSSNNSCLKKNKHKYNQSMSSLPLNTNINTKDKSDKQFYKMRNNVSSVNVTATTAQNSIKTNIGLLSNMDMIKPIQKNKSKNKIENIKAKNCSTPNLFDKVHNHVNLNKEKPNKIYNNSTYLSKTNKKRIAKKIINNRNKEKLNKYNDIIEKEINKTMQNFYNKNNDNLNNHINKTNEKEIKNITENNENSDNTKKESIKELHKIFNDKILQNIDKKNLINDIIINNLELNQNKKFNSRNNEQQNININEQVTINIEENDKQREVKDNKILIPHTDSMLDKINNNKNSSNKESTKNKKNDINNKNINDNNINSDNIYQNYSNYESFEEEKEEKVMINNINDDGKKRYSIFNENEKENKYVNEKHKKNSKENSSTHENVYKNMNDLDKDKNISKQEEQEFRPECDRQSDQTQTTLDKNYILSKFIKQPIYDISSRYLNEENVNLKHILPSKKFLFITDIEEEIKRMPIISFKKILNLSDKSLFNLLSFSYDNYLSIISLNNLVKNKVVKSLKAIFQHAINDFKHKYESFLKVIDYNFIQKNFMLNHKKNNLLNLEIKCEIVTEEINKSYEIGCNYISNNKNYDYLWKIDIKNKKDINIWICTELNKINNASKNFTYTSQVSSFCHGDMINLQFNIFSEGNIINPISIEWTEPAISLVPGGVFEKSKYISPYSFDQIRACEVETQILFWKNILPENDGGIVNEVKKIYGKFFDIQNIRYDVSKFYFFKVEMKANKIGCLKSNKFSKFDINIIDYNENVENEIQCIYLMNSYYYSQKMDIRIGTKVILYIVDMKR
jgi:hypothetical protein